MQPEFLAVILSRIQFGFTVSFHIIFPAFTIGLVAWLAVVQALPLRTGKPVYRSLFDFWLLVFAVAFGLGVLSGIVMAFQLGSNWSELSRRSGPIQGPLLAYESFTAFALEASFFGVLIFGRDRAPKPLYLASTVLVAAGTSLSSFWTLVDNSWMQYPVGFAAGPDGRLDPASWRDIIINSVVWVHFPHLILAAYVNTGFCVAATGAWHLLRDKYRDKAYTMLRVGLGLLDLPRTDAQGGGVSAVAARPALATAGHPAPAPHHADVVRKAIYAVSIGAPVALSLRAVLKRNG